MKKTLTLLLLSAAAGFSAHAEGPLWHSTNVSGEPFVHPKKYAVFAPDMAAVDAILASAPTDASKAVGFSLPMPDGSTKAFRIWSTPIGDASFTGKFAELQTFTAVAEGDARVTAKIDRVPGGFHAMIMDGITSYFIDPYNSTSSGSYLVYDRRELTEAAGGSMVCGVEGKAGVSTPDGPSEAKSNGLNRKTYRLALACTGEYSLAATGLSAPTKLQVLAKMITSVNRVNGVYERELAVTLQLVSDTNLVFLDGNTDPYTNNNGSSMLSQNQTTVNNIIGSANYDIGHVFSTGGGGIASLGALCNNFVKAQGVTGRPNPVGDPFDIDYVAHEIGHQFGGNHTFNANTGSCAGNGENSAAYEPGSGLTIMAYAGICGSGNDLQSNSDAYFHSKSLDEMTARISQVPTCGVTAATGNVIPVNPVGPASYNIPLNTAFELIAPTATVANANTTYCWEQFNLGNFGASYNNTATTGPVWRNQPPDTARTRTFPTLVRVLSGTNGIIGDRLPAVARSMTFQLTTRSVGTNGLGAYLSSNGGQTVVTSNASSTGDTFRVTSFNDFGVTAPKGGQVNITWNVSNSATAPVNCSAVDIFFSTDGGTTFPTVLAAGVPNTGSAQVTLPVVTTSLGRIKIKGVSNVFFAVNRRNITLVDDPSSVSAVEAADSISVFPTPASGEVYFVLPVSVGGVLAEIHNAAGALVWKGAMTAGKSSCNLAGHAPGIYYARLVNAATGAQYVKKIVLR